MKIFMDFHEIHENFHGNPMALFMILDDKFMEIFMTFSMNFMNIFHEYNFMNIFMENPWKFPIFSFMKISQIQEKIHAPFHETSTDVL